MLCLFEASSSEFCTKDMSKRSLVAHLTGAQRVISCPRYGNDTSTAHDKSISSFLGHYLSASSILSYTTLSSFDTEGSLRLGALYWLNKSERPSWEINCFTRCSNELMEIIFSIVARIRKVHHPGCYQMDPCDEKQASFEECFRSRIEGLLQILPAEGTRREGSSESKATTLQMSRTSDAFRQAALVLLEYLAEDSPEKADRLRRNVSKIMDIMGSELQIPPRGLVGHSTCMWPYLIAACHVDGDEDRALVLQTLHVLLGKRPDSKVTVMPLKHLIEGAWKLRDLSTDHVEHGVLTRMYGGRFSWEVVLERKGWALNWS